MIAPRETSGRSDFHGCVGVIVVATAILLGAVIVFVTLYELYGTTDPKSASEIDAELTTALPTGASERSINAYLDSRQLPHDALVVSDPSDTFNLDRQYVCGKVAAGTPIVLAVLEQGDGSLFRMASREITIIFMLDQLRALDRILVGVYDGAACSGFGQDPT